MVTSPTPKLEVEEYPFKMDDNPLPMVGIENPTNVDVLCGRGVTTNRHVGNEEFRALVNCNKELYVSNSKREKMRISRSIVNAIRAKGGRFLERDQETGTWSDVGDKKATEKTSQALRDGAAALRKQLSEDLSDPGFLSAVFDTSEEKEKVSSQSKSRSKPEKDHRRIKSSPAGINFPIDLPSSEELSDAPSQKRRRSGTKDNFPVPDYSANFSFSGGSSRSPVSDSLSPSHKRSPKIRRFPPLHTPRRSGSSTGPSHRRGNTTGHIFSEYKVESSSPGDLTLSTSWDASVSTDNRHMVPIHNAKQRQSDLVYSLENHDTYKRSHSVAACPSTGWRSRSPSYCQPFASTAMNYPQESYYASSNTPPPTPSRPVNQQPKVWTQAPLSPTSNLHPLLSAQRSHPLHSPPLLRPFRSHHMTPSDYQNESTFHASSFQNGQSNERFHSQDSNFVSPSSSRPDMIEASDWSDSTTHKTVASSPADDFSPLPYQMNELENGVDSPSVAMADRLMDTLAISHTEL